MLAWREVSKGVPGDLNFGFNLFSIIANDPNEDMPMKYLHDIETGIVNIAKLD